ncbi:NACHT domain-containing protein [Streptomyces nigrescens]
MSEPSGAVADFCSVLRRLVRGCDVQQTELARALHRSNATVSELLNGRRATPPSLDDVLLIVSHCRARVEGHPPPGLSLDPAWWRTRLAELEDTAEARRQRPEPRAEKPLPRVESVAFDFAGAVDVLIGGRDGFDGLADELLEPLQLNGGAAVELRGLMDGFGARVRAGHGTTRTALLCAADVVLLVTAFCDAVAGSGIGHSTQLSQGAGDITTEVLQELGRIDLGSARVRDTAELREEISAAYSSATEIVHGLGNAHGHPPHDLIQQAKRRYEQLLSSATWDCPELRLTSETYDVDREDGQPRTGAGGVGLHRLGLLLEEFAHGCTAPAGRRERLRAPIASAEGSGPAIPTLAAGYVNPHFRVAAHPVDWELSSDEWWQRQPLRDDIEVFLAAHLLTDRATRAPLLVLGHPGAGKSLLTKLIEARLPETEFFCLRVELRHVPADMDVQGQMEEALFRATGRRTEWPDAVDPASGAVRVVLLDGFDELLQAGAERLDMRRRWDYLKSIERFQQRETELGRPTAIVVTSRTVVADQVFTPTASTVIRLEPFDDDQIADWLEIWAVTNRRHFLAEGLEPLTQDVVRPHRELASQPLLLLMLALYDAVGNPLRRLGGQGIERVELYERLLVEFVRRQVVKHRGPLPRAAEADAVEQELQRLGVIAIGMFNRRGQSIMAREADADLAALRGEGSSPLLFGRFFFVHEAQAVVTEEELRSYEFLHATFGEYLVVRLIGDELRRTLGEGDDQGWSHADDGRLHALLSCVPLTDRAEVVRIAGERLSLIETEQRASLTVLLRELFRRAHWGSDHRKDVPYRPVTRNRTERDAVYSANLLLLAVLAEDGVNASEFFGEGDPVDRWWRCAQLWRSQFSEASWEAFTRTLSLERRTLDGRLDRTWDLRIGTREVAPGTSDLAWSLRMPSWGPTAYHDSKGVDAADLIRRMSFLCETDGQQLLHALSPLLHRLPDSMRTYRIHDDQSGLSAAHALVSLMCRDPGHPDDWDRRYHDVLSVLPYLPFEDCAPVVDVLARHLVHDAARLPGDTVVQILHGLTQPRFADTSQVPAQTWIALLGCVQDQVGRAAVPQDELGKLAGRLGTCTVFALENEEAPQLRLLSLLREAGSTHIWHRTGHAPGREALDDGFAVLERIPVAERSPEVVIGLLRLARELGRDDWLAEHAEPMLLSLGIEGLGRLRATDVDSLRDRVRDTALRTALGSIERVWRGVSEDGRPPSSG